jgi:hypothetical protein
MEGNERTEGMEKLATLEERLNRMEESLTKLVQLAERLASGESVQGAIPQAPQPPETPQWRLPPVDPEKVKELLASDPVRALEAVTEYKVAPILQALQQTAVAALDAQIVKNKIAAQSKYPDWHEYADAIAQLEEALPDKRVLAQPNSYDALYAVAKGFKSYELIEKAKKGEITIGPQFFAEKEGKIPRKMKEIEEEEAKELSEEQKFIAQKFGLTEEEYKKWSEGPRPSIVEQIQKHTTQTAPQAVAQGGAGQ